MAKKGIDVSVFQGQINWEKVKNDGIEFAILRLGYGSDIESQDDACFETNIRECERVGIPWGAYLYSYALNTDSAKSEAQHTLRLLRGKRPEYPIFFDMEDADGYKSKKGMPSNQGLVDICKTFLSTVEDAGYYVSLYASLSWLNNQLNSNDLDRYDKWVAQWHSSCNYTKPYGVWQYSDSGKVNGINGNVDMNYSYLDYPKIIKENGLNGFTKNPEQSQPSPATPTKTNEPSYTTYTIKSGDTLWGIAAKHLGSGTRYPEIKSLNGLTSDTIYPGQKIKIPN